MAPEPAPAWRTAAWLNTSGPLGLGDFRGRVVLLHAFQMLCPGCVAHGIPQAQRVAKLFEGAPLAVVGLHAVFEHHAAMGAESLRAFLHEYRVQFPVGIDAPGQAGDPIPRTMRAYAMQGTPTTILIDAQGQLRRQVFGVYDDLLLGAEIGTLLVEAEQRRPDAAAGAPMAERCADGRCHVDAAAERNPLS
ncbi:MAG: redoxin domain-containing protein [Rhodanobacter sp.]